MSTRTDALVSQRETGKMAASIIPCNGRLPPSAYLATTVRKRKSSMKERRTSLPDVKPGDVNGSAKTGRSREKPMGSHCQSVRITSFALTSPAPQDWRQREPIAPL